MRLQTLTDCTRTLLATAILLAGASGARATDSAADQFGKSAAPTDNAATARQRALAEFDTDGDGKLSASELRTARIALAKKKRLASLAEQGGSPGSGSTASGSSNSLSNSSGGMNPYAIGNSTYGSYNPYLLGNSSGGYYYYGGGTFGQMMPGMSGGGGGGCMSMGSAGGRR